MRIVVDTNVLVSSFTSRDTAERSVLRLCLTGEVTPLMGNALLFEYEDVLARPDIFRGSALSSSDRTVLFEAFVGVAEWVTIRYRWRPNLRDKADNHLIELALAGGADWIVTRNIRDLAGGELKTPSLRIGTAQLFVSEWRRHWSH